MEGKNQTEGRETNSHFDLAFICPWNEKW